MLLFNKIDLVFPELINTQNAIKKKIDLVFTDLYIGNSNQIEL